MTLTDYANGETLAEHDALNITCSICQGLYALHSSGIVHRDIKPDNIIICDDNNVKIIDFDISKIYKSNQRSDTQTLGTVGFAAPEQFGMQQSDARTDLYSLAVLLNVLLTGEHPSVKMCENKKILKVIKKCLSINPDDRYSTAEELYNVLNKIRRKLKYEKMS
jgi:serine/threonine protein kinase